MPAMHAANRRACPAVGFLWNNKQITNEPTASAMQPEDVAGRAGEAILGRPWPGLAGYHAGRIDPAPNGGFYARHRRFGKRQRINRRAPHAAKEDGK
jgi:hypothetical protein